MLRYARICMAHNLYSVRIGTEKPSPSLCKMLCWSSCTCLHSIYIILFLSTPKTNDQNDWDFPYTPRFLDLFVVMNAICFESPSHTQRYWYYAKGEAAPSLPSKLLVAGACIGAVAVMLSMPLDFRGKGEEQSHWASFYYMCRARAGAWFIILKLCHMRRAFACVCVRACVCVWRHSLSPACLNGAHPVSSRLFHSHCNISA